MVTLNKKLLHIATVIILLLISVVGMFIMKNELEYYNSLTNEVYFSVFRILFFATLVFLLGNWLFKLWKDYQVFKNEKAIAELVNLKNQISPHFFFNTLNNLYGLIKKDSDKARDFVLKLSDLMRYSIYSSDVAVVPLKEEIRYLENFIKLHEIRYFNAVTIEFEKNIHNESINIAPLLLIILLENAFKHGAEKLIDNAFIKLNLNTKGKLLSFSVENNFETMEFTENEGLGLKNLQKRLQLLYPDKHGFRHSIENNIFKAELELEL